MNNPDTVSGCCIEDAVERTIVASFNWESMKESDRKGLPLTAMDFLGVDKFRCTPPTSEESRGTTNTKIRCT